MKTRKTKRINRRDFIGLGTALVSYIESLPEYAGLRGILITRDAHDLYRKYGYEVVNDRVMVKSLNC